MIIGVGTDLLAVSRIENLYRKFNDTFLTKIFTNTEIEFYNATSSRFYTRIAAAFAAKEAFSKALGCGLGKNCHLHDIEILRMSDNHKPYITYHGAAKAYINTKIQSEESAYVELSLTHDAGIAHAIVVIWCK